MSRYTITGRNNFLHPHEAVRHDARKRGKTTLHGEPYGWITGAIMFAVAFGCFVIWSSVA